MGRYEELMEAFAACRERAGSHRLTLGAKARAIMQGRYNVAIEDIRHLAYPVLRHRILTNFQAESERVRRRSRSRT